MKMMSEEEFVQLHRKKGFPWCDTCGLPAVWREQAGEHQHVTIEFPLGIYSRDDTSGHKVTCRDWWGDFFV